MVLSLDFEKAFDRVKHRVIQDTLNYYNFGQKLIEMIMLLCNCFEACTINSGEISSWFILTRGPFQGNPLSRGVFILIVDIMGYLK